MDMSWATDPRLLSIPASDESYMRTNLNKPEQPQSPDLRDQVSEHGGIPAEDSTNEEANPQWSQWISSLSNDLGQDSSARTAVATVAYRHHRVNPIDNHDAHEEEPIKVVTSPQSRPRRQRKPKTTNPLLRKALDSPCAETTISSAAEEIEVLVDGLMEYRKDFRELLTRIDRESRIMGHWNSVIKSMITLTNLLNAFPEQQIQLKMMPKIVRGCNRSWKTISSACVLASLVHEDKDNEPNQELRQRFKQQMVKLSHERRKLRSMIPDVARFLEQYT